MKRKIIALIFMLALSTSFVACGDKDDEKDEKSFDKKDRSKKEETVASDIDESDITIVDDITDDSVYALEPYSYYADEYKIIFLDSNSNILAVKDKKNDGTYRTTIAFDGYKEYYYLYNGYNDYELRVYDYDTDEDAFIANVNYYPYGKVYDGDFYLICDEYSEGADGNPYNTYVEYKCENNANEYELVSLLDVPALNDISFGAYELRYSYYGNIIFLPNESFDKYGYVVTKKDDSIYLFDRDGNIINNFEAPNMYAQITAYDENYIVMSYRDDKYDNCISYYDLNTNNNTVIKSGNIEFIAYNNGKVYIKEIQDENSKIHDNNILECDIKSGNEREIVSCHIVPGMTDLMEPGSAGFKIINEDIYILTCDDKSVFWEKVVDDGDIVSEEIGDAIYYSPIANYGTVECSDIAVECPYCGEIATKSYYEYLHFDLDYPATDIINSKLSEVVNRDANAEYEEIAKEDCEWLHDGDYVMRNEEEEIIKSVTILDDKYLCITSGYYQYWAGAAHGIYGLGTQIYDLETGDSLTNADILNCSPERFKEAAAESAKNSYGEYEAVSEFESADYLYDLVYETVSLENSTVIYYEDYCEVYVGVYEIASYAAGSFTFRIEYSDLQ